MRFSATVATSKGGNWLSISPSAMAVASHHELTVSLNANGLAAGTYTGEINIIEFANPGKSMTVPVVLIVAAAPGEESGTTATAEGR